MMTFKKKWIGILASAMAFVLCCIFGVVFALDTKKASAETTYEYETYDVLYTDDFSVVYPAASAGALTDGDWNVTNDQILDFTPSIENTTESFIWNFQYTATQITGAINIYPLSQGAWNGAAPFDFNKLPLSYIAETDTNTYFTQGQIYDVEFGVVKIKNSEEYHVFVKVDGKMVLDRKTADKKGRQLYFYTTDGATGTCSSTRPAAVVDRLTNSDWTIVNANTYTDDYAAGSTMPTEWAVPTNGNSITYIDFTPTAENVSASFVWEFDFLCTVGGKNFNIYPFAGGQWPQGVSPIDIAANYGADGFTAGEIYKIEIGTVLTNARLNDNYRVYVTVDGKSVYSQVLSASLKTSNAANGDGLSVYFNGACKGIFVGEEKATTPEEPVDPTIPVPPAGKEYEYYDVLENSDWTIKNNADATRNGVMPLEFAIKNGDFINFTPSTENTTGSFIWKFKYTQTAVGSDEKLGANIYPLASCAWGANQLIDWKTLGFALNTEYTIEFGVLRLKDSTNYHVYVKANGEIKKELTYAPTHNATPCNAINCTGDDYSKHTGIYFYIADASYAATCVEPVEPEPIDYSIYVDTYDVLYNQNWTWKTNTANGTLGNSWAMMNNNFLDFTPTATNTTDSFIWKFKYTHTATSGAMYIYPFANGVWGNTDNATLLDFNTCGFTAGKTYDVEISVLKLKDGAEYELFYVVDGVKKANRTIAESYKTRADGTTGLYFYFTGTGTNGTCVSDYKLACETYDTLYNQNWTVYTANNSPATGIVPTQSAFKNGNFIDFIPSAENTTGSFIWTFKYKAVSAGTTGVNLYPLSSGVWGTGAAYIDFNTLGLTVGTEYTIEFGVLRIKNSENYYIFVKANGAMKKEMSVAPSHNTGTCPSINCTGEDYSKHKGIYFYITDNTYENTCNSLVEISGALETYDTLYNCDWTEYNNTTMVGEMPANWSLVHDKFINFTSSEDNTTGSFVWKFKYTATNVAGQANIYPLACGPWGAKKEINFNNIGLSANTEYDMEFGVVRIKNSSYYYVYVKANDVIKREEFIIPAHTDKIETCNYLGCPGGDDYSKHTGIYFYITDETNAATCRQGGYVVEVNGEEQFVTEGTTVLEVLGGVSGLLPADRPNGYTTTWYDSNGNKVNAATQITDNVTLTPTYTYNYTIVNLTGETLQSHKHVYGGEASFNSDALTVEKTTFVGYLVGDVLYQDLAAAIDASAASGENVVAKTVTLGLVDGASIRVDGTPSIRFTATIDKSEADANTQIVDYGMLLTTKATLDTIADFTIEELALVDESLYHNLDKANGLRYVENSKYPNQYVYSLILDKVSLVNYGVEYVARAYAVVQYTDGTYEIIYSEFDETEHTRSMYEVASAAITDTAHGYTDAQKAVIQQHIDGVIELDSALALQGEARSYGIAVTNNNDGTHTVTITAKNGFDIKNIGAIYVSGDKVPVYDVNSTAGTFVIKEEDMASITLANFAAFLAEQTEQRELTLNAYSGPSLGIKQIEGGMVDSGYDFTLADLETYMAAGFNAWRLEISPYANLLGYEKGRDIYYALDLAAQYAQKHGKPCKVYVNIPEVTGLVVSDAGIESIQTIYSQLTTYDDGISGRNGVPSPVNGINQIAGFLLMDEPYISDVTAFEYIFKILNDSGEVTFDQTSFTIAKTKKTYTLNETTFTACGAGAAGYDYQIALLQNYAGEENIGKDFNTYVATYAEILSSVDSIGFDSYPFNYEKKAWANKGSYTFVSDWFSLMEKSSGLDNGYTTCIQSYTAGMSGSDSFFNSNSYKVIQYESEISMQVYTALAYGFTNLDYFTYGDRIDYDIQVETERYQEVPVQWNDYSDWSKGYTTGRMYDWIQNTNAEAISLYDALGKFTNNGVQLVKGSTTNNIFGNATTTNTTNAIGVTSTYDMVVGGFTCGTQNGYLAVNAGLPSAGNGTTNATFTLTGYNKAVVYVDGVARVERITNGTLTMNIGSGEGVFIIPMSN